MSAKTVLFSILDWGLGHATRCIPLIQSALDSGNQVIIASNGLSQKFLKQRFPQCLHIQKPSARIVYPKNGWWFPFFVPSTLRFILTIQAEKKWIPAVVELYAPNLIVSDNTYGVFHPKVHSVLLTHQIRPFSPAGFKALDFVLRKKIQSWIENFNELWIPDLNNLLSGDLSKSDNLHIPTRFLGPLSALSNPIENNSSDIPKVLIVLSGPEPLRSHLEKELFTQISELNSSEFSFSVVRGTQNPSKLNWKSLACVEVVFDLANSSELNELWGKCKIWIGRSGYSSLMDLSLFPRNALLIPTPGQTEQEYLARLWNSKAWALSCHQSNVQLEKNLHLLNQPSNFIAPQMSTLDLTTLFSQ